MKTMKHTGKKVLSVFLAVLMVMTAWVFVAPTEASAASTRDVPAINNGYYAGTTGAYGVPVFDGTLDRWFKFHNQREDYVQIYYPSKIYLDKSETLQSAGYFFNVDWHFGHSTDYRILIGANALGDNSQWSGKPDNYYTMTNAFNNYGFDASVPNGAPLGVYGANGTSDTAFDVRIVGYNHSSQGSDRFTYQNVTHNKYVLFRSNGSNDPNTATIYLLGTPNGTYTGKYSTSGDSFASYGLQQNWSNGWGTNSNTMFHQKGYGQYDTSSSNYTSNGWPEMEWDVIIYDKSGLYSEVNNANGYSNDDSKFTTASWNTFVSKRTNAQNVLKDRKVTQEQITTATKELSAAKIGLTYNQYTITWTKQDGSVAGKDTYQWGTHPNWATLSAKYTNSIVPLASTHTKVEQQHQTYIWNSANYVSVLKENITINEIADGAVDHKFTDYTQNEDNHTRECTDCGYVHTQAHIKGTGYETKAETCTENGVMTYDCSVCGKKAIETSVINNITGHDFKDIEIKEDGENGSHWRKCSRCDAYGWNGVEDGCEKHDWDKNADGQVNANDADTKASTCKEQGYEKYTCKVCPATWTKTLPLVAHKTTATAAKDVTNVCGGDGNAAFWTCTVCNRIWKDAELNDELTDTADADNDGIPDALETKGPDHVFEGAYVAQKDGADGAHYRQCKNFTQCKAYGLEVDGVPTVGATEAHNFTSTETASTCTVQGTKTYTCSDCKSSYTEKLPLAAHDMETIEAFAATCTTGGNNKYYKCKTCSQYFKDEAGNTKTTVEAEKIAALKHTFATGVDVDNPGSDRKISDATCMAAAVYAVTCDRCGTESADGEYSYGSPDTINGHKFDGAIKDNGNKTHSYKCTVEGCTEYGTTSECDYEVTKDVDSTCKTAGYTTFKCRDCGNGYSNAKALDSSNHTGEGTYVIGAQASTCATYGSTGVEKCSGCNATLSTKLNDLPLEPANHENMIDYAGQAATCQKEGWKAYKYCDKCGAYEIEKATITKKAHAYTDYKPNNNGTHTAVCDTCDAAVATPETDTKNCTGGTANCVDKKVCTVCKTAYGEVDGSKHKTPVTIAKVPATCQTEGTEAYRYCEACDTALEEIEKIEKLDHTYGAWSKVDGKDEHTRSCTTCDADVADVDTQTADCNGGVAYCKALAKCADCKAEYGTFDADNHSTEANTLKDVVAATCQNPGFSGNYRYDCCDAIKVAGTATEQLDHTFDIEVKDSRIAATCIVKGEVTYKCSTCVESEGVTAATQKQELPIDAKNHASKETVTVNAKAATCESDGHTGDIYYSCCYDSTKTEAENRKALKEKGTVIKANGQHIYGEAVPEYLIKEIKEVKNDEGKVISKEFDLKDADTVTYDEMIAARRDDYKWYHAQICTICYEVTYGACYTYAHTSNCVETDTCEICEGLCSLKSPLVHPAELNYVAEESATCSEDGVKAHYVCSECDEKFSDALGKKPVSDDDLKIDSAGGSHDIDYESAKPIGDGKHEYGCTRCSAKIEEECDGGTDYCNAKAKCEICGQEYGEIDETNHASTKTTLVGRVEATCSEDGYEGDEYYECCYDADKTKEENQKALKKEGKVIPSKPELHVIAYKDIEGDTHTAYCTACEGSENAYSETVAHEWVAGETPELENCTDEIEVTSACACGKTKTEKITGEHDLDISVEVKAATCTADGYKKTTKKCKKCDYSETTEEEAMSKLPHSVVTVEAIKATCDGAGKHAYSYCKNEGCPYGYGADLFIGSLEGYEAYKNNDGKKVDKLGHKDKDNNGSCDNCYNPLKENVDGTMCNCVCHKQNAFMQFIYKILQFFWKLFKIEKTCGCGIKHW